MSHDQLFSQRPAPGTEAPVKNSPIVNLVDNSQDPRRAVDATERVKLEGVVFAQHGNYGSAIDCFSVALQFSPDDYKLNLDRGYAFFFSKRYEEALRDAEKVLLLPLDPELLISISRRRFLFPVTPLRSIPLFVRNASPSSIVMKEILIRFVRHFCCASRLRRCTSRASASST